jgi:nicotinate phosphoribosyltransferase
MRLFIASEDDIVKGKVTDIYFDRTVEILKKLGLENLKVRMEFHVYSLPKNYKWAVFAGLEEVLRLLEGLPVTVYSMPEGTLFKEIEPLLIIEGNYIDFAKYETALLGIIRHSSSIATKAARIKSLAMDKTFLFFGLRVIHPAIAPMADRAAYIGGMDGISGVISGEMFNIKPSGTMPHALIISIGDNEKAWKAFDEIMPPEVPRIALVDTFEDERTEALKAAKLLGNRLYGVRLDTPSSRRGNFKRIIEEVRWTLKIHGFENVKIIASGGIDEEDVIKLKDIVDGFGVGTSIAFSQSIDVSADIVEKFMDSRWVPITKRGKWPGAKQVYRCGDTLDNDIITLLDQKPPKEGCKPLLRRYMENGKILEKLPSIKEIREYVLDQLRKLISHQAL